MKIMCRALRTRRCLRTDWRYLRVGKRHLHTGPGPSRNARAYQGRATAHVGAALGGEVGVWVGGRQLVTAQPAHLRLAPCAPARMSRPRHTNNSLHEGLVTRLLCCYRGVGPGLSRHLHGLQR